MSKTKKPFSSLPPLTDPSLRETETFYREKKSVPWPQIIIPLLLLLAGIAVGFIVSRIPKTSPESPPPLLPTSTPRPSPTVTPVVILPTLPDKLEICAKEGTNQEMTFDRAVEIALESECTQEGNLKEERFCNQNTGTWWIDLAAEKPGCNPACVIDVQTEKAEINWRCTGLTNP